MSNTELIGPKCTMKRPISPGCRALAVLRIRDDVVEGNRDCETSYNRFCTNNCSSSIGKNGRKALATSTENT